MKIFIYHDLFNNDVIKSHNKKLADTYKLHQQFSYLVDLYEYFKKFETLDSDLADYYFVPIFLTGWQFANHDPFDFIKLFCKKLERGNHILVGTGDFGQRAPTRNETNINTNPSRAYAEKYNWLDKRFVILALESTASLFENDIAFFPYICRDIPVNLDPARDIVASFIGRTTQPFLPSTNIRTSSFSNYKKALRNEQIIIADTSEMPQMFPDGSSFDEVMKRSVFVLCPEAYGRWTYRFMEALANGSIPIILADDYVMPFEAYIPWDRYVYRVPEKNLYALEDFIKSLDIFQIYGKLKNIKMNKKLFLRDSCLDFIKISLELNAEKDHVANSAAVRAITAISPTIE